MCPKFVVFVKTGKVSVWLDLDGSNSRLTPNLTQLGPLTHLGNSTSSANASGDVYDSWAMMEAVQICTVMRGPAKKVWWRPSTRSV